MPSDEAMRFAEKIDALYFETSAKEDLCVEQMFIDMANSLPSSSSAPVANNTIDVANSIGNYNGQGEMSSSGCC